LEKPKCNHENTKSRKHERKDVRRRYKATGERCKEKKKSRGQEKKEPGE
jgi:hypothetical protein